MPKLFSSSSKRMNEWMRVRMRKHSGMCIFMLLLNKSWSSKKSSVPIKIEFIYFFWMFAHILICDNTVTFNPINMQSASNEKALSLYILYNVCSVISFYFFLNTTKINSIKIVLQSIFQLSTVKNQSLTGIQKNSNE